MKRTAIPILALLIFHSSLFGLGQKDYIQNLILKNRFYDAITETYRMYYFSSVLNKNSSANLDLDLSRIYLIGKEFGLARFHSQRAIQSLTNRVSIRDGYKISALAYEGENDLANAFYSWNTLASLFPETGASAKACEMSIKLFRTSDTRDLLEKIRSNPDGISYTHLVFLEGKLKDSSMIPQRKESLAFLFSFIPGLSQVYCGKPVEGLIAFIVQTGAGFLTWERWQSDDKVTSVILGLTTFTWYSYNFTRSQDDCQEFNRKSQVRFRTSFSLPIEF